MKKGIIMDPNPPWPWDEKIPKRQKSMINKWMRRILLLWAIKNKKWGIVIILLLIDEGKEEEAKLDAVMQNESGWQEYLASRIF